MLVEFSVENFKAFREKQTFSMVAAGGTRHGGSLLESGISVSPHLLRTACLFGANGSGKSSLIDAMRFMRWFVGNSFHMKAKDVPNLRPFKFHSEWRNAPSEFEVSFVHEETLYQYGFVIDQERVLEEWLFARPQKTQRERQLFSRIFNFESNSYEWEINSEQLKGKRDSWKEATRNNALFLTTAVHLNATALEAPYNWIIDEWKFLEPNDMLQIRETASKLVDDDTNQRVVKFLGRADIRLSGIHTEERDFPTQFQEAMDSFLKAIDLSSSDEKNRHKIIEVYTHRKDENGDDISLSLEEESTGTKALFNLSVPILDILDQGQILMVDELNTGLHPLAFQHLVGLFSAPETNPKGAQLIFTTHDTSVADQECMSRDQIWIVEKHNDLAAKLVPLSDYKVRDAKGFQKKYLDGRFGGIPKLGGVNG